MLPNLSGNAWQSYYFFQRVIEEGSHQYPLLMLGQTQEVATWSRNFRNGVNVTSIPVRFFWVWVGQSKELALTIPTIESLLGFACGFFTHVRQWDPSGSQGAVGRGVVKDT